MFKKALLLLFILIFIAVIIVLTIYHSKTDFSKLPNDFAVVFDAGSSGTRMYIYQWRAGFSASRGDNLVVTQNYSCKTDDNGIDKIKSQDELIQKFSKCINESQKRVPEDRKSRCYIFLAATAGMRLLEAKNKSASDRIFGYVQDYFEKTGFLFQNRSQARIISGQEEGSNAWISANYFQSNFKQDGTMGPTKGVLDLGGASTQITFVPKNPNPKYDHLLTPIKIYGVTYKQYSNSFLCWGVNEIALLYQSYLLRNNNYKNGVKAACYPKGSDTVINTDSIFNSPCANGLIFNYTYNFTANTSYISPNTNIAYSGFSEFENCQNEVRVLLPKPGCSYDNNSCSFDGVYQPNIYDSGFMAFSGFYFAINNTGKLFNRRFTNDMEGFKQATKDICSKSLNELIELNTNNSAGLSNSFLKNQCFSNNYFLLLTEAYGFKSFDDLTITDNVNGYSLNWALGYLINELNRDDFLPYESVPKQIPMKTYLPLVICFSIGTLIMAALLVYLARSGKSRRQDGGAHRGDVSYKTDTQQCKLEEEATPLKSTNQSV